MTCKISLAMAAAAIPRLSRRAQAVATLRVFGGERRTRLAALIRQPPGQCRPRRIPTARRRTIVVTGVRRAAGDVLGGVSVLDEEDADPRRPPEHRRDACRASPALPRRASARPPRARSCAACPASACRILIDGIGTLDLSASDPDHAVTINPLTAERIEVLRGPSALLFGSSAIGGVVNVIDTRIPRQRAGRAGRRGRAR